MIDIDTLPATDETVTDIALDDLHPADDNPRSDLGDLTGLADSIRSNGIIEPLIAIERAVGGGYTIVAGHRRHAAARLAERATAPVIVRTMTNEQRLEVMLIENLQRAELRPLDETRGFQWLNDLGHSQREIAERVGCSQSHVSKRLLLGNLPDAAAELLISGRLTINMAEQLAGLDADDIDEVTATIATYRATDGGELPAWAVTNAIDALSRARKHAAAEKLGAASKLKRLKVKPYEYGGDHRPCKKSVATHWYLGDNDTTVVWAQTAAAEQKTREENKPKASGPAPRSNYDIMRDAKDRAIAYASALIDRTRTDDTIRRALVLATTIGAVEWLQNESTYTLGVRPLSFDETDDGTWITGDPELYLAASLAFALIDPDWNRAPSLYALFARTGYVAGEGEIIPDIPAVTSGTTVDAVCSRCGGEATDGIWEDDTFTQPVCQPCFLAGTPQSEVIPLEDTPVALVGASELAEAMVDPFVDDEPTLAVDDAQAAFETGNPDFAERAPWPPYPSTKEESILKFIATTISSADLLRHVISYERANLNRPAILVAASDRLFELS